MNQKITDSRPFSLAAVQDILQYPAQDKRHWNKVKSVSVYLQGPFIGNRIKVGSRLFAWADSKVEVR